MAAGVGKTYRMLQEGPAEATAKSDVVIAYLEFSTVNAQHLESLLRTQPKAVRK